MAVADCVASAALTRSALMPICASNVRQTVKASSVGTTVVAELAPIVQNRFPVAKNSPASSTKTTTQKM